MDQTPGRRVLLIEDDPDAALFAVHVLTRRGRFEVAHAADPASALHMLTGEHWDLVLADADAAGLELLTALRQAAPAVPLAVLTADVPDGAWLAALRARTDEILDRPLRADRLLAAAARLTA
jgi:CheY-like chemotaxis protein